MSKNQIKQDW